jgi:pyruvate,orthophosphate dikinase
MTWIYPLSSDVGQTADTLGGKAYGLIQLGRLGLPVPPGFVITTEAGRAFLRDGRLPDGLRAELAQAVADLESATGRRFGGPHKPLAVSVRSGGAVSMPGMMSTMLNVGLTTSAGGPADAMAQLELAVAAVFSSWDAPRARTYRDLNGIPHDLGTAVTVQAMVFGNRDGHSGSGVAFSRDPNTGEPVPFGEVLFGGQGDDVVSGRTMTAPLADLAEREPAVWAGLTDALGRVEAHLRDACYLEFTYESGGLWLLQMRRGRFVGRAAVRVAVDLADAGAISRDEALRRVSGHDVRESRTPQIASGEVGARGLGAVPGVAVGRVATTADAAARLAAGGPVILVRPETSPVDMHGMAAAAGILTARGGPASHAAVVARAMGKPAVVGVAELIVDGHTVLVGGRTIVEGELIAIDGGSGVVVLGEPTVIAGEDDPWVARWLAWADSRAADLSG